MPKIHMMSMRHSYIRFDLVFLIEDAAGMVPHLKKEKAENYEIITRSENWQNCFGKISDRSIIFFPATGRNPPITYRNIFRLHISEEKKYVINRTSPRHR